MSIKLPFVVEVPKRNSVCSIGLESFKPGMTYVSILLKSEEPPEFKRMDYCSACWEREGKIPDGNASYWKSKVPKGKEKEVVSSETYDERVVELFKNAVKNSEEAEAFILSLWLVRKRKLILRHCYHEKDGQEVSVYEDPTTEEAFTIRKISLGNEEVLELKSRLALSLRC